jgi:DNA-binding MarR family transcriptional regulator
MSLPDLGCACAGIRRASRLVTLLYAQEMGSAIEPTQFALLKALGEMPGCPQASLGHALGLDKTSLSRNLRLLSGKGWIEPAKSLDRRERGHRLTAAGVEMLRLTEPGWQRAQTKLRAAMSPDGWARLHEVVDSLAVAAREAAQTGMP